MMTSNNEQSKTRGGPSFGIDYRTAHIVMGRLRIPMPRTRFGRIALGILLLCGGVLGFLPILGFWMVPLGFLVLSYDLAFARRWRRRFFLWWHRRKRTTHPQASASRP